MKVTGLIGAIALFFSGMAHAGAPMWTFTALTATTISVAANSTATVQYRVTNQSHKTKTLSVLPMQGVTHVDHAPSVMIPPSGCANPFTLTYQESCVLTLRVTGSALAEGTTTAGPLVCASGSSLQCYQPSLVDQLTITKTAAPAGPTIVVDPTEMEIVRCSSPGSMTVTNTSSTLTVQDLMATVTPGGMLTDASGTTTCTSTLAPGQSCVFAFYTAATTQDVTVSIAGSNTAAAVNVLVHIVEPINTTGDDIRTGCFFEPNGQK